MGVSGINTLLIIYFLHCVSIIFHSIRFWKGLLIYSFESYQHIVYMIDILQFKFKNETDSEVSYIIGTSLYVFLY